MWWHDKRPDKKRSFFRLPGRRESSAETPLRVPVRADLPDSIRTLDVLAGFVEPVAWVTSPQFESPDQATKIRLTPLGDYGAGIVSELPQRDGVPLQPLLRPTPIVTEAAPPGSSLADRLRNLLSLPLINLLPGPNSVLEWPADFMAFQKDGIRTLVESDRILLADDMGLGKTLQVIAALRILIVQRSIETALIVLPASLLDQWRREITKWAPELRAIIIRGGPADRSWQWTSEAHITLVSYGTLRSDFGSNTQAPIRRKIWDVVVADEAQTIKNRNADVSRSLKGLQRRRSWALSGTPIENREDDLASILEFVDQDELVSGKHYSPGPRLLARHRELQLRRKKDEVLTQLPPKLITKVPVNLNNIQQGSYDRAEREGIVHLKSLGTDIRVQHVLELITHLKQICNADPETGDSSKFDDIRSRLEALDGQGHRSLIFSQYTSDAFGVGAISKAVEDFNPLTLVGEMSQRKRDEVIQRFKKDERYKVLVLSLRAGGLGLNLQEASYVFHLDRWWNPAIERQAEDRSYRFGQTLKVNVIKYTCIGTIEERIDNILTSKQDLFDELIDDVSIETRMDNAGLFGLFGLEPPPNRRDPTDEHLSGLELEERCRKILENRGWRAVATPRSGDGGVDVKGTKIDEVGIEQEVFVQCKDHARPVGVQVVRELLGVLPTDRTVVAILASPAGVTADAQATASERNVIIWDSHKLEELENVTAQAQ